MDRGQEIRELKLGASFTNPNARAVFHTLKCESIFLKFQHFVSAICHILSFANLLDFFLRQNLPDDFKPASVDVHKEATLQTGSNNSVTVTLPHLGKISLIVSLVPDVS